jgi:hypothetical protein
MSETPNTFTLDFTDCVWTAVSFGEPWNGWLTPVVTRATFDQIVEDAAGSTIAVTFTSNGTAMITEPFGEETIYFEIAPDTDGNYDLAPLGWTFDNV